MAGGVTGAPLFCLTSTAAPAVSTAAVTTPATALVPIAPPIAPIPPAAPPPPIAAVMPPAAPAPAPALPAPAVPAVPRPSLAAMKPLKAMIGPIGKSAARAFSLERTWERKSAHSSHSRTWRRTGAETLRRPSAASPSSIRTSPQVSRRAWLASAREIRARTSSDLTEGTVVSIAAAISS